ncbi:DUF3572 domain-containing protein [Roseicyclus sp.]|uniref:DUF3572 domain-containing protein n=1 Tax=Roseicyclus sp. TaxID=1914329 RepID=UPI003F9EFBB7
MKQEMAEMGAVRVLGWLAGQEDLMPVFLGATGAAPEDLRAAATEPDFLASVLDFVLMDDRWVIDCAGALGMSPERIAELRRALPGGALPNWT